jgi:hypothetical protein
MKKVFWIGISSLALVFFLGLPSHADSSEQARVIREDKDNHDLIIERQDGTLWLIQHHYTCTSMTTEFPVNLILVNDKIAQLKVNFNEVCKVYNAVPYSGEAVLVNRVKSDNLLEPEHEADIVWSGIRYRVDYGSGCEQLREFDGKKLYLSLKGKDLADGSMVLPADRGQCSIKSAQQLDVEPVPVSNAPAKLEEVQFKPGPNSVYFHWKALANDKIMVAISYSKFEINPDLYPWKGMPNLKYTQSDSYNADLLANDVQYYFYLAAVDTANGAGPWTEVVATPVRGESFKNNPDPAPFQVKMEEKPVVFHLTWPAEAAARRFRVSLYANGKPEFSKLVMPSVTAYDVPKTPDYLGKGLRFTVKSLPKEATDPTYSGGLYWKYAPKN